MPHSCDLQWAWIETAAWAGWIAAGGMARSPSEHHDRVPLCTCGRTRGERDSWGRGSKRRSPATAVCGHRVTRVDPAIGIRGSAHALSGLVRQDEAQHSCTREGPLCVPVVPEG